MADPVHRVLNRLHVLPNILVGLALYAWGGWSLAVWGSFLRIVVTLHVTWLVNSAAHTWGYRTYDTPEGSTNCWWVGLLAWGEGWHNNHHAFQRSARHGHEWWEFDANWVVIRTLAALGVIRDVQLLPKSAERFRLDRKGAPSARIDQSPRRRPDRSLAPRRLDEARELRRVEAAVGAHAGAQVEAERSHRLDRLGHVLGREAAGQIDRHARPPRGSGG